MTPGRDRSPRAPHGEAGIDRLGHRVYVGGMWEEVGRLQFDFLLAAGLRPSHVLLDIACGALRAGVHLIPYLDCGHYLGIEKERVLIDRGLEQELPPEVRAAKAPELLVDGDFNFERFSRRPDFAIAQSLFSHLPPAHIEKCLTRLRAVAPPHCRCFATFFQSAEQESHLAEAHDHVNWHYTQEEMLAFGRRTGWVSQYIGDWSHPRGQVLVEYQPAPVISSR
jgi:hypothetical protein